MSAGLAASGMRGEANGGEGRRPRGEDPDHEDEEGAPPQRQQQQQPQRPAARPPSGPQQPPPPAMTRNVGYVGKHRLSAAIARLDQELQSLQVCAILLAEPTNQPPRPSSSSRESAGPDLLPAFLQKACDPDLAWCKQASYPIFRIQFIAQIVHYSSWSIALGLVSYACCLHIETCFLPSRAV